MDTMEDDPLLPIDPEEVEELDKSLVFPSFTSQTAWELGCLLRTRLLTINKPAVIDITLAQNNHCLFHCTTHSGTTADHDSWVERKRNTVLHFGHSTWYMKCKYDESQQNQTSFYEEFSVPDISKFALFGGGYPIRVKGVEGVVAAVVVVGARPDQAAGIILQTAEELLNVMEADGGEKRKED